MDVKQNVKVAAVQAAPVYLDLNRDTHGIFGLIPL